MTSAPEQTDDSVSSLAHPQEKTAGTFEQAVLLAALLFTVYVAIRGLDLAHLGSRSLLVSLSVIGLWRWGWGGLHYARAVIFRYWTFPRMRRSATEAVRRRGPVPQLCVVATTYHERLWITERVVRSLVREFSLLEGTTKATQLVFVTGGDEDDQQVRRIFDEAVTSTQTPNVPWPPELTLLRGDDGKRNAIAKGLRHLSKQRVEPEGVVVLMDGDSEPTDGALHRMLPIFRLSQNIGAVTTNEKAVLEAPTWFTEWIKLRFGQRHLYMCSVALSRKLLCLTGRMSAFRSDVATNPSFINQVENDELEHWLFGQYKMFSGDDKSTWYWLNAHGYDLTYVPDAMVVTYEVVDENPYQRAVANLKRWSGNMLRNSHRAAALGPGKLRLFPWLCTIDQQVSMWTVLIGPSAITLAALAGYVEFIAGYVIWLVFTRTIRVTCGWVHGRRISFWYIPLQLASEWVGAVVKVWVYFHPVKQTWMNRGNRTLDSSKQVSYRRTRQSLANYYYTVSVLCFLLFVGNYTGLIPLVRDLPLLRARPDTGQPADPVSGNSTLFFGAESAHGTGAGHADRHYAYTAVRKPRGTK